MINVRFFFYKIEEAQMLFEENNFEKKDILIIIPQYFLSALKKLVKDNVQPK